MTTGNPMLLWKLRITGPGALRCDVDESRVITEKTLKLLKERPGAARGYAQPSLGSAEPPGRHARPGSDHLQETQCRAPLDDVNFMRNRPAEADIDPSRKPTRSEGRLFPNLKTGTDDDLPF